MPDMDSLFFALIYKWLGNKINHFSAETASRLSGQVTSFALIMVTLWVLFKGYRLVTGQSRDSMMATVTHMAKIALIVVAAQTVSMTDSAFSTFLNTTLPQEINYIATGSNSSSPVEQIDKALLKMSAATSAIDMVQVPTGDTALAEAKARTSLIATLGIAAPAMTAGAMLLLYQIAFAMLVGFAPLFIMCLIFDQTKELFRRWLMYLLATLFSVAVLNVVIAWMLQLTLVVAEAAWATDALSHITGQDAQGFDTRAFQQGGVGLLATVLIVSTPPLAAALFNGTLGNGFMHFAATNGGGGMSRPGPHGEPPGSYGGGGRSGPSHTIQERSGQDLKSRSEFPNPAPLIGRVPNGDVVKKPYDGGDRS